MKAFQYMETYGEVCPPNRTPDSLAIKESPEASKEYLTKYIHKQSHLQTKFLVTIH